MYILKLTCSMLMTLSIYTVSVCSQTMSKQPFMVTTLGLLWWAATASTPLEPQQSGLTLSIYDNTATAGAPASSTIITSPVASFIPQRNSPFSAEITGTLVTDAADAAKTAATATSLYTFDCDFTTATLASVLPPTSQQSCDIWQLLLHHS